MSFINEGDFIGNLVVNGTYYITGAESLTYLAIIITMLVFFMAFKVPLDWSILFILPLLIVITAYNMVLLPFTLTLIVILGIIFASKFIL